MSGAAVIAAAPASIRARRFRPTLGQSSHIVLFLPFLFLMFLSEVFAVTVHSVSAPSNVKAGLLNADGGKCPDR